MAAKEKKEVNLPAYTTIDNMFKLMDALRKKNGSEEEAKPISGLADNAFSSTKSALKIWGLIDGNCKFTSSGRDFAYAVSLDEKQSKILDVITAFLPYENLLHSIFQKDVQETAVEEIVSYWGRYSYGSTERNRKDAASLFANCIEYVGLGKFIKGAQGNSSRIIWNGDAKKRFFDITEMRNNCKVQSQEEAVPSLISDVSQGQAQENQVLPTYHAHEQPVSVPLQLTRKQGPTLIVKVDMTNWDDAQIKNFFKYAHGHFD